ncbi:MAG: TraU family protein, partial [Thiotrichales bacterium]|nr:TraU family protein [Thiotrichales bacterium]
MKKTILSISILAASINVQAEEINTADVVSRTTSAMLSCADYKVTGICYWLLCTPFGCSVKTSVRVSHYLPDITVQTYRDAEEPP